jgi:transposase
MKKNLKEGVIYVGLDVDDKYFHGYSICSESLGETAFKCKPTVEALIKALSKIKASKKNMKICYESGHLGFSLQRTLSKKGYHCDVVATSLIPVVQGNQVKTDRIDSKKLAKYYQQDCLTLVHVPNESEEMIRNLIRSRSFLKDQLKRIKLHLLFLCRGKGLHYREGEGAGKSYWTGQHLTWLERQKNAHKKDIAFCFNISQLLNQLEQMNLTLSGYESEIQKIAESESYSSRVKALTCYRGIDILSAMTLITEIGDIRRFKHPAKLCSYAGLDIREYSSGGKERKMGITKLGNRRIRTTVIESSQQSWRAPYLSKRVKKSRGGVESNLVKIADRCMQRLYKKSTRLLMREKAKNKVTVACAREQLCFVWESLQAVA